MTLVEVVVAAGITSIIALAICTSMIYSGRTLWGLRNYIELDNSSRNSLEYLMADLRVASGITGVVSNSGGLTLTCTNASRSGTIQYTWDSASNTVQRIIREGARVERKFVLTNCDQFDIKVMTRTMASNWEPTETQNWSQGKFVVVTWHCTKKITVSGAVNTEKIQTARIMLRNQHMSKMLQL